MLDEALHDALDLSKLRCQSDHRLEPHRAVKIRALSDIEVRERRQALSPTLGRNAGSLNKLRLLAKDAGYCMLITDAECVVVQDHADSPEAQSYVKTGLKCGTVWQEARAGTNGLGMCAETHRVVTVAGRDHFFEAFHGLACTAAPILDDDNQLLGVINMTGTDRSLDLNGGFVRQIMGDVAEQIQAEIFRHSVGTDLLVEVRDGLAARPNALMSLTEDGMISKITQSATDVLATGWRSEDVIGQRISNFVAMDVEDMVPMIGRTQYVEILGKGACFLTPQGPLANTGSRRTSKRRAKPSPVASARADLGTDPKLQRTFSLAQRMLENGIAVVLDGESGSGKLTIARELHKSQAGIAGQETLIDCAVVGIEELSAKVTEFLDAQDMGTQTLLLREIGSLPQQHQAVLYGLLTQRPDRKIEQQIISTASGTLSALATRDVIIPELLYMLKGAALTVSALRDRSDLENIVAKYVNELTSDDIELAPSARAALLTYAWPGNIPELMNAIRFGLACAMGDKIEQEDLPQEIWTASSPATQLNTGSIPPSRMASTLSLTQSRDEAESQRIKQALLLSGWNVSDAAQSIGVSRATMHRKMKAFGIERSSSRLQ